jgi:hypothetical protein
MIPLSATSPNRPDGRPTRRNASSRKLPVLQEVKKATQRAQTGLEGVFSQIHLEADSGGRPSYMPYNALHFPALTREAGNNGASEAMNMWTVGLLHNEDDTGPTGPEVKAVREYEVSEQ